MNLEMAYCIVLKSTYSLYDYFLIDRVMQSGI